MHWPWHYIAYLDVLVTNVSAIRRVKRVTKWSYDVREVAVRKFWHVHR